MLNQWIYLIFVSLLFFIFAGFLAVYFFVRKQRKQKRNNIPLLTDWDQKCMAYHEAGHAICSHFLPEREKLIIVTIDPSSEAFGMVCTAPRPHHNETRISLSSRIATFLAGQLAEEIFLGIRTTSCIYDLASAQGIAADMVTKFGMGKCLGLAVLNQASTAYYSDRYSDQICMDIQSIMHESEENAKKILSENKLLVIQLAEILLKQKTLTQDELIAFFEKNAEKGNL